MSDLEKLIRAGKPGYLAPEWPDQRPTKISWRTRPVSELELGPVTTARMAESGFKTLGDVDKATYKELESVHGVGKGTIENKIYPRIKRWKWEPAQGE